MEQRDRGVLYYQLGRWTEAHQDLEDYLGKIPQVQDRPLITQLLDRNYPKFITRVKTE